VFVATLRGDRDAGKRLARQVAINSWIVIVVSMLIGTYVLALFGISLPVVRVAGGLLVAATGWRMLHSTEQDEVQAAAVEKTARLSDAEIVRRSFLPLTFPLTTGPGTIAAAIALGAQIPSNPLLFVAGAVSAALGALLVAILLYLIFANAAAVLRRHGPIGTMVMMRLMAFILLCVGIQIMWTGFAELAGIGT
jgi:multiple antibiotic resistance protein